MASPNFKPAITSTSSLSSGSRLLDNASAERQSQKKVIVVGRPGCGTDAIGDILKALDFKVYDFKAANDRHARDFALWLEAAQLRKAGMPHSREDYDKIIGDHDALVSAPTCFFDHEFVKLYPDCKVIMITCEPDIEAINTLANKLEWFSKFKVLTDKKDGDLFVLVRQFLDIMCKAKLDQQAVRNAVAPENLLELNELSDWQPLCKFLGVKVPENMPVAELHDNTTAEELALRPMRILKEIIKVQGDKVTKVFKQLCIGAGITYTGKLVAKHSTPAAAAIVFGMCALAAAHYWSGGNPSAWIKTHPCQELPITIPTVPAQVTPQQKPTAVVAPLQKVSPPASPPQKSSPNSSGPSAPSPRSKDTKTSASPKPAYQTTKRNDPRINPRTNARNNTRNARAHIQPRPTSRSPPPAAAPRARPVPAAGAWGNFAQTIAASDKAAAAEAKAKANEMVGQTMMLRTRHNGAVADEKKWSIGSGDMK